MKKIHLLLVWLLLAAHYLPAQEVNRYSLTFSNDGVYFASSYETGSVEVHDITTGKKVMEIAGSKKKDYFLDLSSISFSPDKTQLAIASNYHPTEVYNISSGKKIKTVDFASKVIFSSTGKLVTVKEREVTIYSRDAFVKEKSFTLPDISSEKANPCTVDGFSDKIIFPLFYSDYAVMDVASGALLFHHKEDTKEKLRSIQVSNDAAAVITCGDSVLKIFNINTGDFKFKLAIAAIGFTVPRACLTERGMLYTGTIDGESIRCIDINTGKIADRESINFGNYNGRRRGFYFAPRLPVCAISYSAPYKKKAYFNFLNVVTRESNRIFLE